MTTQQQKTYIPRRAVVETTLACNMHCLHCGSRAGQARGDELSTQEFAELFTQLAELGCESVTLSGGEPLMREDWLALVRAAAGTGMRVGMFTNGIAFDAAAAEQARAVGLGAVGFSVDGVGPVHDKIRGRVGHFARLERAMDSCRRAGLAYSIVSHINRLNVNQLAELHDWVAASGAFAWQIQHGSEMGNLRDNRSSLMLGPRDLPRVEKMLAALVKRAAVRIDIADSVGYFGPHEVTLRSSRRQGAKRVAWGGCHAGQRVIGIESNGNVKGCLSIMAGYNDEGADFVEGNIRERSLREIWESPDAFAYNRRWKLTDLGGFCRTCHHAERCRGGCRSMLTASGDGVENPMCTYRVLCEQEQSASRAGRAAAVVLAASLGAAAQGCDEKSVALYGMPWDGGPGGDVDAGVDAGSDDTGIDEPQPLYGMAETDTETEATDDVGIKYGMPDTDTEGEVTPVYGAPEPSGA